MPIINLQSFDTQHKPMSAVSQVVQDYIDGFVNSKEALSVIYAIDCEWKS